jgi:hypothetical protein
VTDHFSLVAGHWKPVSDTGRLIFHLQIPEDLRPYDAPISIVSSKISNYFESAPGLFGLQAAATEARV